MEERHYETIRKMEFKTYRNSRAIDTLGGEDFSFIDSLKAAIISRSNIFLLSRSGPGKTQIECDVLYGMFGGKGVQTRGDLNVDINMLYKNLNLEALRTAKTSEEAIEITSRVRFPVVIMDEYNRAPGPVQHQFFNVCDGYIIHNGVKLPLGTGDYSIGIASGNISNGDYSGVFETDRALIDRAHIIFDLDHWYKTADDGWAVLEERDDPRVKDVEPTDMGAEIMDVYNELKKQKVGTERLIAALYLEYGLNYCSGLTGNSKRDTHTRSESACGEKGGLCSYLNPASTRQMIAWMKYSKGIEAAARSKGANPSPVETFLTAIKIAAPLSGMLDPAWVQREHGGSYCRAMDDVIKFLKKELEDKSEAIVEAVSEAKAGELTSNTLNNFTGEWEFMKPRLNRLNTEFGGKEAEDTLAPARKAKRRKVS